MRRHNQNRQWWMVIAVGVGVAVLVAPLVWSVGWVQPVRAQQDDITAECVVRLLEGASEPFTATFEQCVDAAGSVLIDTQASEVFASWGDLLIRAELGGDVYFTSTPDAAQPEWVYWGNWRLTMDQIIDLVARDLDAFWSETFASGGFEYRIPEDISTYNMQLRTACGIAELWNAFYCSRDHSIYLDRNLLAREYKSYGDFAPATILAHEWGHAMQAQMGLLRGQYYTISIELQADCFAGAWARHAENDSDVIVLEPGDIEEGAESLFLKGDDLPWFDPRAHGTGEQRHASFLRGYEFGVAACLLGALTTDESPAP